MAMVTPHPEAHSSVTHNIGAGLQRTVCRDCGYIGVSEDALCSRGGVSAAVAAMAVRFEDTSPDPWGLELVA